MLLRSGRRLSTLEEAARATVPGRRRRARPDLFAGLPEEILLDILARLPAKSVLRCRAVCRLWRRLASDPAFLLDHHRRQPVLPLIESSGKSTRSHRLNAVHLRSAKLGPFLQFPDSGFFNVESSCDGLLIDKYGIYNPATRQWAALHQSGRRISNLVSLFRHQPSGEYRVLYWGNSDGPPSAVYCLNEYRVLTVGTSKPRCVDCSLTPVEMEVISGMGPRIFGAPVSLNGDLYVHWRKRSGVPYHKILLFDTVAESFRHMRPPAVNPRHVMHLFDIGGTLAASTSKDGMTGLSIFTLLDREQDIWAFQYRITLPAMDIRRFQEQGDWWAKVVSDEGDVLVSCYGQLLQCDKRGNLVANFKYDDDLPVVLPHRLKESLVQHTFFNKTQN